MSTYQGATWYVTLGDGHTESPIDGIGTIEIEIETDKKLNFQNMIYIPQLNVSLYSINQYMKYIGCYKHSTQINYSVTFPAFTLPINNKGKLEFTVRIPFTSYTVRPDFDENTAELYAAEVHSL